MGFLRLENVSSSSFNLLIALKNCRVLNFVIIRKVLAIIIIQSLNPIAKRQLFRRDCRIEHHGIHKKQDIFLCFAFKNHNRGGRRNYILTCFVRIK